MISPREPPSPRPRRASRLPSPAWPLVVLRVAVVAASFGWLALARRGPGEMGLIATVLAAFAVYGLGLVACLWWWPAATLRVSLPILGIDLAFALLLIQLTGGARSVFFLALYLLVGLEGYHRGLTRGLLSALVAAGLYLLVVWPTIDADTWADLGLREGLLVATAAGLGAIGRRERAERRATAALATALASRDRFVRDVERSLREGMITVDREGRIQGWNRTMENWFARPFASVAGRRLAEVFEEAASRRLAGLVEALAGGGEASPVVLLEAPASAGGPRRLGVKGSVILDPLGAPRGTLLLVEDLTERIRLEELLRRSERLAGLGLAAQGIAHEINNPAGVIASRAELLLDEADRLGLPAAVQEDLEVIRTQSQRVGQVTRALLAMARERAPEQTRIDLNDLLTASVREADTDLAAPRLRIRAELTPGLGPVAGDPGLLRHALVRLLRTARAAADGRGEVLARTEPDPAQPGHVRLVIRSADLPGDLDVSVAVGSIERGFDLALCYGIVRAHDGTMTVDNQPCEGMTAVITLPGPTGRAAP